MNRLLWLLLLLLGAQTLAATAQSQVPAPEVWKEEVITLPPDFAPTMAWKGREVLKFSPGMFKAEAEDFFSYVFSLELHDTDPDWEKQLLLYYSGLAKAVLKNPSYDTSQFKVVVSGDEYPKTAVIHWVEPFITKAPQKLNLRLSQHGPRRWSVSVSPQTREHQIWKRMEVLENQSLQSSDLSRAPNLFETLAELEGQSFVGAMTFPEQPDHPMNQIMKIEVQKTTTGELRIPLQVGDDRSRTWVLSRTESGIQLKHEHRHADGHLDATTNYGGCDNSPKLGNLLIFPADQETAELLPEASSNVWSLRLSPDGRTLTYYLERHARPRFEAQFKIR